MRTYRAMKYGNVKTEIEGERFDSRREAARWKELRMLERAGRITCLRRQVPFELIPKSEHGRAVKYIADFVYMENGRQVIEDAKGYRTAVYKLKRRMMAEQGREIVEV